MGCWWPCCGGDLFTHREISSLTTTPSVVNSGDYGAVIQPTGSGVLHGVTNEFGSSSVFWITGTRESSITSKRINNDMSVSASTIDFGSDTYAIIGRVGAESDIVIGGVANGSGYTVRAYKVSDLSNVYNDSSLDTRVNGMGYMSLTAATTVLAGLDSGGDTIAAIQSDGSSTLWSEDPTSGDGEASAVSTIGIEGVVSVVYKDHTSADNLHLIDNFGDSYTHIDSVSALGGENLHAVTHTDSQNSTKMIVVGGESDGSNTVEAFDYTMGGGPPKATGIGTSQWTYNTGSTVRGIKAFQTTFAGTYYFLIVGDRNASNKTTWIVDESGSLVASYDHGEDLRACLISGVAQGIVVGDRV